MQALAGALWLKFICVAGLHVVEKQSLKLPRPQRREGQFNFVVVSGMKLRNIRVKSDETPWIGPNGRIRFLQLDRRSVKCHVDRHAVTRLGNLNEQEQPLWSEPGRLEIVAGPGYRPRFLSCLELIEHPLWHAEAAF